MIEETLKERKSRYGDFKENAECSQALKEVMRAFPGWERLSDSQKESLELNATKDSRIITGDCDWKDNWVDKEGYCRLIVKELEENEALDEPERGFPSFEEWCSAGGWVLEDGMWSCDGDNLIEDCVLEQMYEDCYEEHKSRSEPNEDDLPTIPLSLIEFAKSKGFWREDEWWVSTGPPLGLYQMQQMHKEYLNPNKYPHGI